MSRSLSKGRSNATHQNHVVATIELADYRFSDRSGILFNAKQFPVHTRLVRRSWQLNVLYGVACRSKRPAYEFEVCWHVLHRRCELGLTRYNCTVTYPSSWSESNDGLRHGVTSLCHAVDGYRTWSCVTQSDGDNIFHISANSLMPGCRSRLFAI